MENGKKTVVLDEEKLDRVAGGIPDQYAKVIIGKSKLLMNNGAITRKQYWVIMHSAHTLEIEEYKAWAQSYAKDNGLNWTCLWYKSE